MKIRVTSVVSEEVAEIFRRFTVDLEDAMNEQIGGKDFGGVLDQFSFVFISVDDGDDRELTYRLCKEHNKVSRYKDLRTGKVIKYASIAVPFHLNEIFLHRNSDFSVVAKSKIVAALDSGHVIFPKGFLYDNFVLACCQSFQTIKTRGE